MKKKILATLFAAASTLLVVFACSRGHRPVVTPVDAGELDATAEAALVDEDLDGGAQEEAEAGEPVLLVEGVPLRAAPYPFPPPGPSGYCLKSTGTTTMPAYQACTDAGGLPDAGTGGIWYQSDAGTVVSLAACPVGYTIAWASNGLPVCIYLPSALPDGGAGAIWYEAPGTFVPTALPIGTQGQQLVVDGGVPYWITVSSTAVTWANDLAGSNNTHQYVVNISGGASPGTVTVTAPTLSCSQATSITTTSGALSLDSVAGVNVGTSTATGVSIARTGQTTTVNGPEALSNTALSNASTVTYHAETANTCSTTATITWTNGQKQEVTLSGACTLTFSAPAGPCNVILRIVQDTTGGRTITWPTGTTGVKWPSGTAPTLSTVDGGVDIVSLYYNGTAYYGTFGIGFQ